MYRFGFFVFLFGIFIGAHSWADAFAKSDLFSVYDSPPARKLSIMKRSAVAAQGVCISQVGSEQEARDRKALNTLRQNNVIAYTGNNSKRGTTNKKEILDPSDKRLTNLARVIRAMDNIGDGRFKGHRNLKIIFGGEGDGPYSRQMGGGLIQLNPSGGNMAGVGSKEYGGTHNMALIAHEIGHQVGNSRPYPNSEKNVYIEYFNSVPPCHMTGYCSNRERGRNEEFSEVFAAYITNPTVFANASPACQKGFQFFANLFGEKNPQMSCSARYASLFDSRTLVNNRAARKRLHRAKVRKSGLRNRGLLSWIKELFGVNKGNTLD